MDNVLCIIYSIQVCTLSVKMLHSSVAYMHVQPYLDTLFIFVCLHKVLIEFCSIQNIHYCYSVSLVPSEWSQNFNVNGLCQRLSVLIFIDS